MPGQATTVEEIEGGARWVLVGDPTTAAGAGMVSLGRVVRITRTPSLFRTHIHNEVDQTLDSYGHFADHQVEVEMMRRSAAILAAMIDEYSDETTSVGMSTTYSLLTGITLVAVLERVKSAGTPLTDLSTEWYPSVVASNIGAIANQIINGVDKQTYTVAFVAQTVAVDQDGQALNDKYRQAFRGDPADAINEGTPTAWSLPAVGTW